MRTTWIALLGLGSCLVATAVTAAESPVYEHLKDLECFVGLWESESVVPESSAYSKTAIEWQGKTLLQRLNISWTAGKNADYRCRIRSTRLSKDPHATLWGWIRRPARSKRLGSHHTRVSGRRR